MSLSASEFVMKFFPEAKRDNNGWMVNCPCSGHKNGDHKMSLHISEGDDGKILCYCFAGHDFHDVCAVLDVKEQDCFPNSKNENRIDVTRETCQTNKQWKSSYQYVTLDSAIESYRKRASKRDNVDYRFITKYEYPDGSYKVRYEASNGIEKKKTFAWIYPYNGRWIAKKPPDRKHNLFVKGNFEIDDNGYINLMDEKIFLVEGEKDCITIYEKYNRQYTAVSGENGAGYWKKEYADQLMGHEVLFIPDNDAAGEANREKVLSMTADKAHIYIVQLKDVWSEIPEKGDVTDMFEKLGDDEAKTRLYQAIQEAKARGPVKAPEPKIEKPVRTNVPEIADKLNYGPYWVDDTGVYITHIEMENGEKCERREMISNQMILPRFICTDIDTGEEMYGFTVRKIVDGKVMDFDLTEEGKTIFVASTLARDLAGKLSVSSETSRKLANYFRKIFDMNRDVLEFCKTVSHLGWYGESFDSFLPYCDNIRGDVDPRFAKKFKAFIPHGDYAVWLETAQACREESIEAQIAMAAAFGSPLLEPLHILSSFVHVWGSRSSSGKTVVGLMLPASIYGNPKIGAGYTMSFDTTKVGCEVTANYIKNLPLFIDERQLLKEDKNGKPIWNIYELTEGAGRTRSDSELGLREDMYWNNFIITTGEMPLIKGDAKAGEENRIINIICPQNKNLVTDVEQVLDVILDNYGFAGKIFIEHITQPGMMNRIKKMYSEVRETLKNSKVTGKQANAGAIIIVADIIADECIFKTGKHLTIPTMLDYLKTDTDVDTYAKLYLRFMSYLTANDYQVVDKRGERWKGDPPSYKYIGIKREDKNDCEHYYIDILYNCFLEIVRELDPSSDPNAFLQWLNESGKTKVKGNRKYNNQHFFDRHKLEQCVEFVMECNENSDVSETDGDNLKTG